MSLKSSEDNYKLAKKIYTAVSEAFYSIENEDVDDEDYLIDQTLDHVKHLNRIIGKISLDDLAEEYSVEKMEVLENNVDVFNEAAYFIERSLTSMQLFNKLNPVLGPYMKRVDWRKMGESEEMAAKKFGAYLTDEKNYPDFKNLIQNIIKGTISAKAFEKLFDNVASRTPSKKRAPIRKQTLNPPEMWSEEDQDKWNEQKAQNRMAAMRNSSDEKAKSFGFSENFIALNDYNKLLESLSYECQTCGERAEHEEIEENPGMRCPNCGDSDWETEH